jgi:hypothetical protein
MIHTIKRFIAECVGVTTDLKTLLLTIARKVVSIMSPLLKNLRMTHLKFINAFEKIRNIREYFKIHRICLGKIVSRSTRIIICITGRA